MREEVIDAGFFGSSEVARTGTARTVEVPIHAEVKSAWRVEKWNPEDFAQEQIRGLVRRVFFGTPERVVRQVVFSAVEPETDVHRLCRLVGETLAEETTGSIAVSGNFPVAVEDPGIELLPRENRDGMNRLRQGATKVQENLWLVRVEGKHSVSAASLHQYLSQVRREFEYSIVAARSAAESNQALAMAQFADGIILVLSAQHTRRATALRIKQTLEGSRARLMGTVLSDRLFPMPAALYRRL
jgi:hypothetical protein